jgi:hypothetical protein
MPTSELSLPSAQTCTGFLGLHSIQAALHVIQAGAKKREKLKTLPRALCIYYLIITGPVKARITG